MRASSRLRRVDLLESAASGIRTRRLRSALSAAGVALGIAALVAVLGISESSKADLLAQLDRLGTNLLTVSPGQTFAGADATLPKEAVGMIELIGPVQSVSATAKLEVSVRRTDLVPKAETGGIAVRASDVDLLEALNGKVAKGTFLNAANSRYPAVVLGSVAAERLGIGRADGSVAVWLGERWFVVVGILEPLPLAPEIDRSAIVGHQAATLLFEADGSPTTIYVRAIPEAVDDVRRVLAATANPAHPEEVQVSRPSDALEARAAAKSAFTALFLGLGAVALLVGGVGIANVMVITVLERRWEVGLRRALGATRRDIRRQFLYESLILSGLGGVTGAVVGALVAAVYAVSRGWPVAVPAAALAGAAGAALAIGGLAGLYPAIRAAQLPPSDALRTT